MGWVGCCIWYNEEGTGRGRSPPMPLLVVPNVTAHPSMASVPTSYYSMWHYTYVSAFGVWRFNEAWKIIRLENMTRLESDNITYRQGWNQWQRRSLLTTQADIRWRHDGWWRISRWIRCQVRERQTADARLDSEPLTLNKHIKPAKRRTIIQQYGCLYTGRCSGGSGVFFFFFFFGGGALVWRHFHLGVGTQLILSCLTTGYVIAYFKL